MRKMKKMLAYFTVTEWILWLASLFFIVLSFFLFDRVNYPTMLLSLLGATALIFCAKGNPIGQALIIIFGIFYALISYQCAYYGEMITYAGMTVPMAIIALVSWLKNPFKGNKAEVKINRLSGKEWCFAYLFTTAVTFGFYFILKALHTANLIPSTISVTTSFLAVYLTFRRSPYYALAYAANDVVLVVLWILASVKDLSYLSVVICFIAFLVNDIYGYFNWRKMEKRQAAQNA